MASLFSLHEIIKKIMLIDPNYVDLLRNLQIKFISEKKSDILDISDLGSVNKNKKTKDIFMDIIYLFYSKVGYWKNNYKNYLARLK